MPSRNERDERLENATNLFVPLGKSKTRAESREPRDEKMKEEKNR